MKKTCIISIFSLLFSCTTTNNKFPDYLQKEPEVYMKLLSFDEGAKDRIDGFYGSVSIKVYGKEGLLYRQYKEDVVELDSSALNFLIQHLKEGDSCTFKVSSERFVKELQPKVFNKAVSEYLDVNIKVHRYFTSEEYMEEKGMYDEEMKEQLILTQYLKENNAKPFKGIFIEKLKAGEGESIKKGDVITIAYKGYFTNRLEFDNIFGSTAFTFTYGTSGQVIEGLNIAINGMKKGEKSKIILSSQLAFGEEGSTTHLVPPFTTVIYELEIINVK